MRVYLDHNASSPLRPQVREAMVDAMSVAANASSIYQEGRKAKGIIERARDAVAAMVGAEAKGVTFTSGGSEANATILQPKMSVKGKPVIIDTLLVSSIEHDSVLKAGQFIADQIEMIPVDGNGIVDLNWISQRLAQLSSDGKTVLMAVMFANNETGVLQPVEAVGALAADHGAYFLCDAIQGPGKALVDINKIGAHFLTLSAHKLGGPQGVGAIVRRSDAYAFQPLIRGGGQEAYGRAGTENVVGIHGFGIAAELVGVEDKFSDLAAMRDQLEDGLEGVQIFGDAVDRLPNTSYISLPNVEAETMLISLDLQGFAVSSGSACSSGKVGPSYVLKAMGYSDVQARSAIRISLGWNTEIDHVKQFVKAFNQMVLALKPTISGNEKQPSAA
ncbi:MAG: cysteine desulfurase [Hyphomicrobiales bacterium]|nr:MAG: cysteine desulfurase [Hyphomicrobiales bacterium]